ncbi:hypothetical protein OEZ81_25900, partial [Leclercia adecarboxylata]|uniref:hypothetical protein n=1 Tax=Leclercia adecarboxylata TaxID=83655 RepID=UPI00234D9F4E
MMACLAFTCLLLFYRPSGNLLDAYRAIAILFAIPTIFYIASHTLLGSYLRADICLELKSQPFGIRIVGGAAPGAIPPWEYNNKMPSLLDLLRNRLSSLLPSELKPNELRHLLSPRRHPLLLCQRRATLIVNRVRLFAFLFAVLTPLWSLID